jgi:hypothetical protein
MTLYEIAVEFCKYLEPVPVEAVSRDGERHHFAIEVRSNDDGDVDVRDLEPAARALSQFICQHGLTVFESMQIPMGSGVEVATVWPRPAMPIRAIRLLQVLPDVRYLIGPDDEIVRDADGDPVYDDAAMSAQKVPFWRVRFDVCGF